MGKSLYEKVFDIHTIKQLAQDQFQVFIGLHLIHEATTAPAFEELREKGLRLLLPERTFATADHVIPTVKMERPFKDIENEEMMSALEQNVSEFGIQYFAPENKENGIVHIIGPEYGITQPGMTIVCGDSHTSTHGAFGSIAIGIGTSQVRDVFATQSLPLQKLKVRKIEINGKLQPGVSAKDVALHVIKALGVKAGVGFAHEYAGTVVDAMTMDERMTLCNMSVEGGARCGYVNPDQTTYEYLKGRRYAPAEPQWEDAIAYWESIKSDQDADYDDVVLINGDLIEPMVTWGITLDQSISISGRIPTLDQFGEQDRPVAEDAYEFMHAEPSSEIQGKRIDVAFVGSCTNGRLSDFLEIADAIKGKNLKVASHVKALLVPGSQMVRDELVRRGLDRLFEESGFEFREIGCSMCLAMNPDKLEGDQVCASSSNRNFKGRQGSPTGKTHIMSPLAVAASAIRGVITEPRSVFGQEA